MSSKRLHAIALLDVALVQNQSAPTTLLITYVLVEEPVYWGRPKVATVAVLLLLENLLARPRAPHEKSALLRTSH